MAHTVYICCILGRKIANIRPFTVCMFSCGQP